VTLMVSAIIPTIRSVVIPLEFLSKISLSQGLFLRNGLRRNVLQF
jgi:hypothetical protein